MRHEIKNVNLSEKGHEQIEKLSQTKQVISASECLKSIDFFNVLIT